METLRISDICTDGGTQPRAEVNWLIIADYAHEMREGAQFPPVTVFYDGTDYWLADGFHRIHAAKEAGLEVFAADVRQGTRRDAILYSVGANAAHGLRRTNADKRRAVETLLRDGEWQGWSDREIARRCAVSNNFVSELRHSICPSMTDDRKAIRNGTTYPINTSNIGKAATPTPVAWPSLMDVPLPTEPSKPLAPEVQAALTDLAFQAPDDAPAFMAKALDERLAPDAIAHMTRIASDPEIPDALKAHILQPGEIVRDAQGIVPSEITRGIAREFDATPHAQSLPFGRYLMQLDGYQSVEDSHIEAWLAVTPPESWPLCTRTFQAVRAFIERVESLMRERQSGGLRIVK